MPTVFSFLKSEIFTLKFDLSCFFLIIYTKPYLRSRCDGYCEGPFIIVMLNFKKLVSPVAQLLKSDPDAFSFLKEGDVVEAKLLQKANRAAYFDLGKYGTGIVFGIELASSKNILKDLETGAAISAKVSSVDGEGGLIELSLSGAYKQKNWQEIRDLRDSGEPIGVKISAANSGGLVADLNGIKAFLPVSQLATEHYPRVDDADKSKILTELRKLVGEEIMVKILDFNPRNNKLIISEREAGEKNMKDIVGQYKVGDEIDGIVSGVADFGAFIKFVDNPAVEGLVHISELDHRIIDSPKEVIKVDEAVRVKIIEIKDGQVSLSLKALKENPWDKAEEFFKEGDEVKGEVYKYSPFGAYINLPHNLQGMIHVSEFEGVLEDLKKTLEIGSTHKFVVSSMKSGEKRIVLQLKK